VKFFEAAEVTIGPIYDVSQMVDDPHFLERELIADYPDAEMGTFPMAPVVPRLSGTPGAIRAPAPKLGEHNRELMAEIGIREKEFKNLVDKGILKGEA
jgi:formyl-CoA transferase